VFFRPRWENLSRMPEPGRGVIVAINHISHIDTLLMARLVWRAGRAPRFMVKGSLFRTSLLGALLRATGQIPVYRGTTDAARSLRAAAGALERGEAIVIYPEGTITADPAQWPMQGRTGVARLALMCPDTPIVPIGQWGVQQRGTASRLALLRRRTSLASVGHPLDLRRYHGTAATGEGLREITDGIMTAIRDEVAALRGLRPPEHFHRPRRRFVDAV
jgi:1-acyl-sn-glycerol-3-phosphate acyltransferase